jgi:hypothetical protein
MIELTVASCVLNLEYLLPQLALSEWETRDLEWAIPLGISESYEVCDVRCDQVIWPPDLRAVPYHPHLCRVVSTQLHFGGDTVSLYCMPLGRYNMLQSSPRRRPDVSCLLIRSQEDMRYAEYCCRISDRYCVDNGRLWMHVF